MTEQDFTARVEHYLNDLRAGLDDICLCGHDRGSHWDGHGDCGYCGHTAGNGTHGCEQYRAQA